MIINLTPHPVNIYGTDGEPTFVIEPQGASARLACEDLGRAFEDGPVVVEYVNYGSVYGLPAAEHGTWYVVSLVVALAAHDRADLLIPYGEVRNQAGTVIGCRQLARPV